MLLLHNNFSDRTEQKHTKLIEILSTMCSLHQTTTINRMNRRESISVCAYMYMCTVVYI